MSTSVVFPIPASPVTNAICRRPLVAVAIHSPIATRSADRPTKRPSGDATPVGRRVSAPATGPRPADEPVPAPGYRLDEARPLPFVLQRFPELADRLTGDVLRDRDVAPHRIEQGLLGHQLAGTLRQVLQHGEGLGPQADGQSIAVELSGTQIEPERRKVDRRHPDSKSTDVYPDRPAPFQSMTVGRLPSRSGGHGSGGASQLSRGNG